MSVNKAQVQGRFNEAKGKIKELTGKLIGNEKLQAKGRLQRMGGAVEGTYGDIKRDMRDLRSR